METRIFRTPRWLLTIGFLCVGALFASGLPAAAQDNHYPSRPIRLIVGFPPGGGVDAVARIFADRLSGVLGQPVVVMNHGGAAGGAAAKLVAAEPPDGYSVLINSNSMLIFSLMNPEAGLDIERDLRAVASVAPQAIVIVASPEIQDASLTHLMALAHTRVLTYGSPGSGSIPHLVVELLSSTASGLQLQHVPFQGAAPALTAVMGNQIDFASVTLPAAVALVTVGKVKGVVVTSDARSAALPQIPTAAEAGYPGIAATTRFREKNCWFGSLLGACHACAAAGNANHRDSRDRCVRS